MCVSVILGTKRSATGTNPEISDVSFDAAALGSKTRPMYSVSPLLDQRLKRAQGSELDHTSNRAVAPPASHRHQPIRSHAATRELRRLSRCCAGRWDALLVDAVKQLPDHSAAGDDAAQWRGARRNAIQRTCQLSLHSRPKAADRERQHCAPTLHSIQIARAGKLGPPPCNSCPLRDRLRQIGSNRTCNCRCNGRSDSHPHPDRFRPRAACRRLRARRDDSARTRLPRPRLS